MAANKQFQVRCVYCGGTPVSKEHIWSKWIRDILPPEPWHASNLFVRGSVDPNGNGDHLLKQTKRWEGAMQSRAPKIVCRTCNNGWMSQVDERAKAPLTKMIRTGEFILSEDDQSAVAAWVAKSAITGHFVYSSRQVVCDDDLQHLMKTRQAPPNWQISASHYIGYRWDRSQVFVFYSLGEWVENGEYVAAPKTDTERNSMILVFAIGDVAFEVRMSSLRNWSFLKNTRLQVGNMIQVWPSLTQAISWPTWCVGDDFLDYLAKDFHRTLVAAGFEMGSPVDLEKVNGFLRDNGHLRPAPNSK